MTHQDGHKVVILHDIHEEEPTSASVRQCKEMEQLLNNLKHRRESSTFHLEHRTGKRNGFSDYQVIHLPIEDALKNGMKSGSLEYQSFDQRSEVSRRGLLLALVVEKRMQIGPLPQPRPDRLPSDLRQHFHDVSLGNVLADFAKDKQQAQELLPKLPPAVQKVAAGKIKLFDLTQKYIQGQMQIHGWGWDDHWLECATTTLDSENLTKKYFAWMVPAHTVYTDMFLCSQVLNDDNPISIVHAGEAHARVLERYLWEADYQWGRTIDCHGIAKIDQTIMEFLGADDGRQEECLQFFKKPKLSEKDALSLGKLRNTSYRSYQRALAQLPLEKQEAFEAPYFLPD